MKTLNLLLLIILIPACKMLSPANADDLQIVDQARNKQALILDVRTPAEFAQVRVKGATLIPLGELSERLDEVSKLQNNDKARPIAVYCKVGGRAGKAKKILEQAGYTNVINIGGYNDWPYAADLIH